MTAVRVTSRSSDIASAMEWRVLVVITLWQYCLLC